MSWLDQIVEARSAARSSIENPSFPLTHQSLIDVFAKGTKSGKKITVESSMRFLAVYRAVSIIAGTGAGLPLKSYITVNSRRSETVSQLLRNPHPGMTAFEWKEILLAHIAMWGNFYAEKVRDGNGQVVELWPILPNRVEVELDKDSITKANPSGRIYKVTDPEDDSKFIQLTDREIFHVPGFGYNGLTGLSPIGYAREAVAAGLATEEYAHKLWANGALASHALMTKQRLDPAKANQLKERWRDKVAGLNRAHEIAILDSGVTLEKLGLPPQDAQFIETRKYQRNEIAMLYGVPPHLMADVERSTSWGSGLSEQTLGFIIYTLKPGYLQRVESRASTLLPADEFAEFEIEGLLRGDSKARAEFYRMALDEKQGWMNRQEVRDLENLPVEAPADLPTVEE